MGIQLLTIEFIFAVDLNENVFLKSDEITLHFNFFMEDYTRDEVDFKLSEGQSLTSDVRDVVIYVKGVTFRIPIQVTDDENQHFSLFSPDQLLMKIEGDIPSHNFTQIDLNAIVFEQHNLIPIGVKKTILTSSTDCLNACLFQIIAPIQNNSVNQYQLAIYTEEDRFQKYLILKEGVAEFLKSFNPLVFDITDGKKISLFESEWVAERQMQSEIIYRDQQQVRSVQIITQPDHAQVYFGNERLGITPLELFFTQDTFIELTIQKEGYYEQHLIIDMRESQNEFHIELEERNKEIEAEW